MTNKKNSSSHKCNKPYQPDPRVLPKPYPKNINTQIYCILCQQDTPAILYPNDIEECILYPTNCSRTKWATNQLLTCPTSLQKKKLVKLPYSFHPPKKFLRSLNKAKFNKPTETLRPNTKTTPPTTPILH